MIRSQDSDGTSAKNNLKSARTYDDDDDSSRLHDDDEVAGDNEEQRILSNTSRSHRSQTGTCKGDNDNMQYEDPMVSELKQTEVRRFINFSNYIVEFSYSFSQLEICTNWRTRYSVEKLIIVRQPYLKSLRHVKRRRKFRMNKHYHSF